VPLVAYTDYLFYDYMFNIQNNVFLTAVICYWEIVIISLGYYCGKHFGIGK